MVMVIGAAGGGGLLVLLIFAFSVIAYKLGVKSKEISNDNGSVPISVVLSFSLQIAVLHSHSLITMFTVFLFVQSDRAAGQNHCRS